MMHDGIKEDPKLARALARNAVLLWPGSGAFGARVYAFPSSGEIVRINLLGRYEMTSEISEYSEGDIWKPYKATDHLHLAQKGDGVIIFDSTFWFTNFHSCGFAGEVYALDDGRLVFRAGEGKLID